MAGWIATLRLRRDDACTGHPRAGLCDLSPKPSVPWCMHGEGGSGTDGGVGLGLEKGKATGAMS